MSEYEHVPDDCLLCIAKTAANHFEPDELRDLFQEVLKRYEFHVKVEQLDKAIADWKRANYNKALKSTTQDED